MTSVCVIVVSFQAERLLGPCLHAIDESLSRYAGQSRVLVVDNGSTDGSRAVVRAEFPHVGLIELGDNRGFPHAVNVGVEACDEEWVLLVNPDMRLEPDAVRELIAAADGLADVGAVAAQVRFVADPSVLNSAGLGVDRLGVAFDLGLGQRAGSGSAPFEVFGASAGAALYRRAMLEDIGGFDASFFLYLEDVDVAWRARARGWRTLCAPRAEALHEHSATAGHGSSSKLFHVGRNRVRLLAKNADRSQLLRYGPRIAAYDLAYVAFVAVRRRDLAPARGRLAGLREWRSYRRRRLAGAPVTLAEPRGLRAALARNRAWDRYSARTRTVRSSPDAMSAKRRAPRLAE